MGGASAALPCPAGTRGDASRGGRLPRRKAVAASAVVVLVAAVTLKLVALTLMALLALLLALAAWWSFRRCRR